MKFLPKEDIKSGRQIFEAGNTYDNAKYGVADSDVNRWYSMGLTEIEGKDPTGARQVTGATLEVQNSVAGSTSSNV